MACIRHGVRAWGGSKVWSHPRLEKPASASEGGVLRGRGAGRCSTRLTDVARSVTGLLRTFALYTAASSGAGRKWKHVLRWFHPRHLCASRMWLWHSHRRSGNSWTWPRGHCTESWSKKRTCAEQSRRPPETGKLLLRRIG
ncbi:zinc finger protein 544 isoform X22 [Pongo abelii]|uniref:zinc finger protein 544 isoform X22 n=1 Tax=Pongo abelii TaxID=9601 RepID=UPI003005AEE9